MRLHHPLCNKNGNQKMALYKESYFTNCVDSSNIESYDSDEQEDCRVIQST